MRQKIYNSFGELPELKKKVITESQNVEQKELISDAKEAKIPDIKELDDLIKSSEEVVTISLMTGKDIDSFIKKRQQTLEKLKKIADIQESRFKKIDQYAPLKDLKNNDYNELVKEEIINVSYAERLKKIDEIINKLQKIKYPKNEEKNELEKLLQVRDNIREKILSQIESKKEEINSRKEEIREKILTHYQERIQELEKIIHEIESNPQVIDRLHAMAQKEKKESEEKIKSEKDKIIKEATRYIQSLKAKHENAFKRMKELINNEELFNKFLKITEEKDKSKIQSIFDQVRDKLIKSIIQEEGEKQLKDAKEIVPWEVKTSAISYFESFNFLKVDLEKGIKSIFKNDEEIQKFLKQQKDIIDQNEILRKLFSPKWIEDKKTKEKRMGKFWAAFEIRKENDAKGITEMKKKVEEEAQKRQAALEKTAQEIIGRGGFIVEVPVQKTIEKGKVINIKEKGVVRLEKYISKKGNDCWKVVEVCGTTNEIKVGDISPLDMCSFPQYLKEAAEKHFWRLLK